MLSAAQEQVLKFLYQRLREEPLYRNKPDDMELYVPIYQSTEDDGDPIERLARHIIWRDQESLQMFSGFRGAGKTTELLRLKQYLEEKGYIVLYANALSYINPAGTIDISDFLLTLAGAFGEQLQDPSVLGGGPKLPSFWDRLPQLFKDLKLSSIHLGPTFKIDLRSSATFRQRVQEALTNHIGALKEKVDEFIRDCLDAISRYQPDSTRQIVFLFDSLEQIRGTASTELAVQTSVERLFGQHVDKLQLRGVHLIYTVPPWLKFVSPGIGRIELLPSVKQWSRDSARTAYPPGNRALRTIIEKRLGDGLASFFANDTQLDRLVGVCGGHFRDLLLLVGETMRRAQSLPIADKVVEQSIAAVRGQYLPIAVDDAIWLQRISDDHSTDSKTREHTARLIRFLDTHMVLYLRNGDEWYDVHPLIREEVRDIVEREKRRGQLAEISE